MNNKYKLEFKNNFGDNEVVYCDKYEITPVIVDGIRGIMAYGVDGGLVAQYEFVSQGNVVVFDLKNGGKDII